MGNWVKQVFSFVIWLYHHKKFKNCPLARATLFTPYLRLPPSSSGFPIQSRPQNSSAHDRQKQIAKALGSRLVPSLTPMGGLHRRRDLIAVSNVCEAALVSLFKAPSELNEWLEMRFEFLIAWENSRHLTTLPLVSPPNDVWETSAEKFHTDDASLPRSG